MGAISVLTLAGGVVLAYFLHQGISLPVRRLMHATTSIGGGDLDHRVEIRTGDEMEKLADSFNDIADRLQKAYLELEESYFGTLEALAASIDARDAYTHDHSRRVALYASILAAALSLPPGEKETVRRAGMLHDLGKIGVRDHILDKPGTLTPDEWEEVKKHPARGFAMLEKVGFLARAREMILRHHERYDGRGYPGGLGGEDIPLGARILAVADAFDAMTSRRVYRPAKTMAEAVREIRAGAGTQFDPQVVEVLVLRAGELKAIREAEEGPKGDGLADPAG